MVHEAPLTAPSPVFNALIRITVATLFVALTVTGYLSQPTTHASTLGQATTARNPLPANEKNTALGLDHFDAHCAKCHGATGKGDTELGKKLGAADLTLEKTRSKSDAELFRIISRGIEGTAMPAFAKTHSPTEIWQTILFLKRLPTLTADERKRLEAAIPAGARHKHGEDPHKEPPGDHQHTDAAKPPTKTAPPDEHQHSDAVKPPAKTAPPAEHQHTDATKPPTKTAPPAEHRHEDATKPPAKTAPPTEHQHTDATKPPAQPQKPTTEHQHEEQPGVTKPEMPVRDKSAEAGEHAGHETAGAHDMAAMMSTITGGPFKSMAAIGSGTSLLPASGPGYMWQWTKGDWMVMAHGDLKVGFNHQGGRRGVNKAESQNWLMLMGERQAGGGRLMLRGMFSAEPWTAPNRGFPELFQTGETFGGRPIIDAQHPHDLFMELAAAYTLPLSENVSINLYGGPVGEPALGPVAFMHRTSAAENPAPPLAHHWQDSTHIAHGVFTAGVTAGRFRIESSIFRGAEPDEDRTDIEMGKLDSYSGRIWFTPTPNWTMQASYGYLTHPEAIEPGNLKRWTASIHHNRSWQDGHLASSLIWGRNSEEHGHSNAYLLESTVNFIDKNYLYTRLELGDKIGLLQENIFGRPGLVPAHRIGDDEGDDTEHNDDLADRWFRVGAVTFGGVRDIIADSKLRLGIGADLTFYHVPDGLKPFYGSSPKSFHIFLRIRPGKMGH